MKKQILSIGLLLVALFGWACRGKDSQEPTIDLASVWEMTGQVADFGEAAQRAVGLAVEDFNANRSAEIPRVRLLVQDTQSTPQGAASAFQAVLVQGRPIAVLGPLTSGAAMVIAPLAERRQIVLLTTASIPDLSNAGPFTFRIYPSDTYEAEEMARYARQLGIRGVAVIFPQNDYGVGLDKAFVAGVGADVAVKAQVAYPPEQSDFRVIAAKALSSSPEAIYAPGYPATVAPLARSLRSAGFRGPILSSLGIGDPLLFELGGADVDGIVYTVTALPDSAANPARAAFEERFRGRFGTAPGFPALYGWDLAMVVLESIASGARSAGDLQRAFRDGATFTGVTGQFTFDANGDVRRVYALMRTVSATKTFEPVEPEAND